MTNVRILGMYDIVTHHYSSVPESAIDWLLQYDSTLIMEPGKLADLALGNQLLTNNKAKIVILTPGRTTAVKPGDYAHLFFEKGSHIDITEGMVTVEGGFSRYRLIKYIPKD